ncbi:hypothetical protein [Klebsiella pneumoniae IS39]|nr:hypothetical protein [Klebsiella pneumoniae IS39]
MGRDAQRGAGGYGDVSARGALSGGGDFRDRAGVLICWEMACAMRWIRS